MTTVLTTPHHGQLIPAQACFSSPLRQSLMSSRSDANASKIDCLRGHQHCRDNSSCWDKHGRERAHDRAHSAAGRWQGLRRSTRLREYVVPVLDMAHHFRLGPSFWPTWTVSPLCASPAHAMVLSVPTPSRDIPSASCSGSTFPLSR